MKPQYDTRTSDEGRWVCVKSCKVGAEMRTIGQDIPEAFTWPRPETWERQGYIKFVAKVATLSTNDDLEHSRRGRPKKVVMQ